MMDGNRHLEAVQTGGTRAKSAEAYASMRGQRRGFTVRALGFVALMFCFLLVPALSHAQTRVKSIEGKVLGSGTSPLGGAIVYLQDEKTNVIKTLIATTDGGYRFAQLPADTDYQIWAEYKGKKSKVRLVSSFDTKADVTHNFHISDN